MGERLDDYLRSLPDGLDSFPQYRANASMVRLALEHRALSPAVIEALPEPLRQLAIHPPLASTWVPEVHYCGFSLAIADAEDMWSKAFGEFWYAVSKSLTTSPLYAGLLAYLSPRILLRSSALRWSAFHRGIGLTTRSRGSELLLTLTFPPTLPPLLCVEAYTQVFSALVDTTNAGARMSLVEHATTTRCTRCVSTNDRPWANPTWDLVGRGRHARSHHRRSVRQHPRLRADHPGHGLP